MYDLSKGMVNYVLPMIKVKCISMYLTTAAHVPHYSSSRTSLQQLTYLTTAAHVPHYSSSRTSLQQLTYLTTAAHVPHYSSSRTSLQQLTYLTTMCSVLELASSFMYLCCEYENAVPLLSTTFTNANILLPT